MCNPNQDLGSVTNATNFDRFILLHNSSALQFTAAAANSLNKAGAKRWINANILLLS
jgi:hypothetical protein